MKLLALLGVIAVELPNFMDAAHDYLFPAWIYGTVIVLWLIWIKLATHKS